MTETSEEKRARASRMAKGLFIDHQYHGALEYAEKMIKDVEDYADKTFWMLVRQEIVEQNNPKSSVDPKYKTIAGQTKLKGEVQ